MISSIATVIFYFLFKKSPWLIALINILIFNFVLYLAGKNEKNIYKKCQAWSFRIIDDISSNITVVLFIEKHWMLGILYFLYSIYIANLGADLVELEDRDSNNYSIFGYLTAFSNKILIILRIGIIINALVIYQYYHSWWQSIIISIFIYLILGKLIVFIIHRVFRIPDVFSDI